MISDKPYDTNLLAHHRFINLNLSMSPRQRIVLLLATTSWLLTVATTVALLLLVLGGTVR